MQGHHNCDKFAVGNGKSKGGIIMPNGGHISCVYCTYNRSKPGTCDIFGIETSPFILCRAFRKPKQSHTEARNEYAMLKELSPGVVYGIGNDAVIAGNPRPIATIQFLESISDKNV